VDHWIKVIVEREANKYLEDVLAELELAGIFVNPVLERRVKEILENTVVAGAWAAFTELTIAEPR
jgi:hypothetical protein